MFTLKAGWKSLIIALKDLEFESSSCDCNDKECPDAILCSDSRSPQLKIFVHAGVVVDAIEVNGKRFGTQGGPDNKKDVLMQPAETIKQIKYGIERHSASQPYNNAICGLRFITEADTYGPYGRDCETEYTISVPEEMTFPEFLKQELTYIGAEKFVAGFRNRIPTERKLLVLTAQACQNCITFLTILFVFLNSPWCAGYSN